jgi:hypothetical protein
MAISASLLKWGLRFYPPLLFQRIWVVNIAKDFKSTTVKVNRSLFNINYNSAIFGGTLFCAADPFHPIMMHQVLINKGYKVIVWSKSAQINFLKPGATDLRFTATLTDADIAEAEHIINTEGKYTRNFIVDFYNKAGEICVTVSNEVYIRNLSFTEKTA